MMAYGINDMYEVTITVREVHPAAQPYGIKFVLPDTFAQPHHFKDIALMMHLAQKVLTNFGKVYLAAVHKGMLP
jgi:hypothetical protein